MFLIHLFVNALLEYIEAKEKLEEKFIMMLIVLINMIVLIIVGGFIFIPTKNVNKILRFLLDLHEKPNRLGKWTELDAF